MERTSKPCPTCGGEGGHAYDDEKPIRATYDYKHGETFLSNWWQCQTCGGEGVVDDDEEIEE